MQLLVHLRDSRTQSNPCIVTTPPHPHSIAQKTSLRHLQFVPWTRNLLLSVSKTGGMALGSFFWRMKAASNPLTNLWERKQYLISPVNRFLIPKTTRGRYRRAVKSYCSVHTQSKQIVRASSGFN